MDALQDRHKISFDLVQIVGDPVEMCLAGGDLALHLGDCAFPSLNVRACTMDVKWRAQAANALRNTRTLVTCMSARRAFG